MWKADRGSVNSKKEWQSSRHYKLLISAECFIKCQSASPWARHWKMAALWCAGTSPAALSVCVFGREGGRERCMGGAVGREYQGVCICASVCLPVCKCLYVCFTSAWARASVHACVRACVAAMASLPCCSEAEQSGWMPAALPPFLSIWHRSIPDSHFHIFNIK